MATETETTEENQADVASIPYLLGKKAGMTQIFTEEDGSIPVTVLEFESLSVIQVKTPETDGYSAIKLGYGSRKAKNVSAAEAGQSEAGPFEVVQEFRLDNETDVELSAGDEVDAGWLETGDKINATGVSKGKGFTGVVKRHGFSGGPRTHGDRPHERAPGSVGSTGPARVLKGTRMAGRSGSDRVTVQNLSVKHIDEDAGKLYIKGALPGKNGGMIEVTKSNRS